MSASTGSTAADGSLFREAERQRISRELHDSTSQLLVALQLQLGQLKRRGVPGAEELLAEMDQMLRDIQASIRQIASPQSGHDADPDRLHIQLAKRFYSVGMPDQSVPATAIDPGQAVRDLVVQLDGEQDDAKRRMLRSALVAQEDRFGSASERLNRVDEVAEGLEVRIARQREIVATVTERRAAQNATRLLANMLDTLMAVTAYRQQLVLVQVRNSP